ncbi:beta-propeller domain-containing protein [Virgibacillus ndiopensis]|uniref:beta-propeller domain-containing protein n=1 Tax=Virgibacillus ndiopensis TaxID=2004408 RepID=UPI000C081D4F|nr:beta-propeller domain-containing protein [Virgibacillus ndiopensis]
MNNKSWLVGGISIVLVVCLFFIFSNSGEKLDNKSTQSFKNIDTLPNIKDKDQLISLLKERTKAKQKLFSITEKESTMADNASGKGAKNEGASPVSKTNEQVSGIDEGDIIKTDGDFIYFARDSDVIITQANNENSKFISKITEKNFNPTELYLHDNLLIIIGHTITKIRDTKKNADNISMPIHHNQTTVFVYDVANRTAPKKMREVTIEGTLTASRKMKEHLYLIANEYPPFQILNKNKTNTDLRPIVKDTAVSNEGQPLDYDDMYFFPDSNEKNFLLMATLNLNDLEKEARVESYLGASQQMYMSKNHIYIAVNKLESPDTKRSREKMIAAPVNTEIIQFKINRGKITYNAKTTVNGTLINQFAMDERDGIFRIATTKGDLLQDDEPSTNNLYTYDLQLNPLGSVEGLAKGERIYSVRFMEDIAYMVTFKQVDPLFVIDLNEPKKPTVLGKLKIPGFSNYLHPLDENHVIGFGENTKLMETENGDEPLVRSDGIKISLFDVSDLANPKEIDNEIIGQAGSYTELNYNHNALYKHPKKSLFGFPAILYKSKTVQQGEATYEEQTYLYEGAFLYHISADDGIVLKDKITHQSKNTTNHPEWQSEIRRIVSVDNTIYTLSFNQMKVYNLNEEKVIQTVKLPKIPDMY